MLGWASAHSWKLYLEQREGADPPYSMTGSPDHAGMGHDPIVPPGSHETSAEVALNLVWQVRPRKALCSRVSG